MLAAAVGQLGREHLRERRGHAAPVHATSSVSGAVHAGRLAARMEAVQPRAPRSDRAWARRLWAAPTTAVGLLLAATSGGRWSWDRHHGTIVVRGARSPLLAWAGYQANAIGHVIVSRPDPVPPALLEHEAAHVRQAEVLGPATLPAYVWWLARYGYRDHPMERGARSTARARTGTGGAESDD